jgi:phosphatidate cytidylyltransferase
MLGKRIITALWGIPLVILAVWFDGPAPWFTILAALCGLLAAAEFYRLTGVARVRPLAVFGLVWTLLFILQPHCPDARSLPVLLTAGLALSLIMLVFLPGKEGVWQHWAWMTAGALYIGWLLGLLVALREEAGRDWLYLALFATFASDTAAYFIGKATGKHQLAPRISPGKTWEGAIAGVGGAVIIGLLFTLQKFFIWNNPVYIQTFNYIQAIVLGASVSVFGQLGDLAESLLKRSTGVKDSGSLMPGHGGLLDRMDSILFAGVVIYLYYFLFVL